MFNEDGTDKDRTDTASGPSKLNPGVTNIYTGYRVRIPGVSEGVHLQRAASTPVWNDTVWEGPFLAADWGPINQLTVGRGGDLYMVVETSNGRPKITYSADDGTSWTPLKDVCATNSWSGDCGSCVSGNFRVYTYMSIGVDASPFRDETIYVVYTTKPPSGAQDVDVYLAKGLWDGSTACTWDPPVLVSNHAWDVFRGCAEVDQFWPFLTVDERGYLHLIYYEACDDNNPYNDNPVDVYPVYAFSDDGGHSFQRFELGGTPPVPYTVPPDIAGRFIGDYIGIDSGRERVYTLYTGPSGRIYSNRIDAAAFNPADFNADCTVDLNDFNTFAECFGLPVWRGCYLTDLDGDCDVDLNDFATFAVNFAASCPGGWPAAGQSQSLTLPGPLDVPTLADWTVQHVPPSWRTHLAARSRALADRSDSVAEVATLCEFAALITR